MPKSQCFLARRDGRGRAAGWPPSWTATTTSFTRKNAGFFGFFESVDDVEVAARGAGKPRANGCCERGAKFIRGPVNPSTNYECGMLVEGFDSSPNGHDALQSAQLSAHAGGGGPAQGQGSARLLVHAHARSNGAKSERVARRAAGSQGVTIRTINMKNFDDEVQRIWKLYNATWARNWGFVPMTREEFLHEADEMKQILKPELVLIGEVEGRAVGFALALPDINLALKPAGGNLFPLGLLQNPVLSTIDQRMCGWSPWGWWRSTAPRAWRPAFTPTLVRNARKLGYGTSEMSWILEDNVLMNRSLKAMGAKAVQNVPNLRMELRTMRSSSTTVITEPKEGQRIPIDRPFREVPEFHASERSAGRRTVHVLRSLRRARRLRAGRGPHGQPQGADVRLQRLSGPDHAPQGEGSRRRTPSGNMAADAAARAC